MDKTELLGCLEEADSQEAGALLRSELSEALAEIMQEEVEALCQGLRSVVAIGTHASVKARWDAEPSYRPKNLAGHIEERGWPSALAR